VSENSATAKKVTAKRTLPRQVYLLQPFLKWAGGKRQLLSEIRKYIPKRYNIYFEPFIGAAAVLFDLQPQTAIINDANAELINCYQMIKEKPEELITAARKHKELNTKEYFYKLRGLDRTKEFQDLTPVERAARIIYLNKTCFNGLFRVNSNGQFNVPYGDYKTPSIVDEVVIKATSRYLNEMLIQISNDDFEAAVSGAGRGDFVYFDPPYDPVSDTASFTGYDVNGFDKNEQKRLKKVCDELSKKKCKVLLSNSATDFIKELYSDETQYTIIEVEANRNINSVGSGRGKVSEVLIYNNYDVK
jgi:DNA adenine methylase